jgi:uncharacterized membrane protein YeaQ/YmgE (transglycosylase-associated protein family)
MEQMGWLTWLVVGAIAGWLVRMAMKTDRQQGIFVDIFVGIVGAFVGGLLFNQLGSSGVTSFNIWSVLVAFTGAIVLLVAIRLLSGGRVFSP